VKYLSKKVSKSFRGGEKGFTLIELLIVIVILGILSSIAIPNVTKFIKNGKVAAANSELVLVRTAMSVAMVDAGVNTLTIGTNGPAVGSSQLTTVVSSSQDFTILAPNGATSPATYNLSDYIQGGLKALVGTYKFGPAGDIILGSYPGVDWGAFDFH
jgi:prepilin-type N-terminal cleavage/methylation domain-containing protein